VFRLVWLQLTKHKFSMTARLIVGAFVIFALVSQTSGDKLEEALSNISLPMLSLSAFILLLANIIRAIRFRVLAGIPMPLAEAYRLTTTYNVVTAILPAGMGELYLPYACERDYRIPYSKGLTVLLMTRLPDLVAVAGLLELGAVGLAIQSPQLGIFGVIAAIMLVGLFIVLRFLDHFIEVLSGLTRRISFFQRFSEFLSNLAVSLRSLHWEVNRRARFTLIVTTALIWLCSWVSVYLLLHALRLSLDPLQVALSIGIVFSASIFPISGLANFGIRDAGWTLALILTIQLPHEQAIAAAFAIHLLTLCSTLVIWFSGYVASWSPFTLRRELRHE
jgi:uncharacterized membrane protein YbhN (UPF0104 family)